MPLPRVPTDPDLAELATAWSHLPASVKRTLLDLARLTLPARKNERAG